MTRLLSRLAARRARRRLAACALTPAYWAPYGPDPYVFGPGPAGRRYVPEVTG